jgi:hypothetical protein
MGGSEVVSGVGDAEYVEKLFKAAGGIEAREHVRYR